MILKPGSQSFTGQTAAGVSAGFSSQSSREVLVFITLANFTGTSIAFQLQGSADGQNWVDLAAATVSMTANGTATIAAGVGCSGAGTAPGPFGDQIRVRWTPTAVTSADFVITAVGK